MARSVSVHQLILGTGEAVKARYDKEWGWWRKVGPCATPHPDLVSFFNKETDGSSDPSSLVSSTTSPNPHDWVWAVGYYLDGREELFKVPVTELEPALR